MGGKEDKERKILASLSRERSQKEKEVKSDLFFLLFSWFSVPFPAILFLLSYPLDKGKKAGERDGGRGRAGGGGGGRSAGFAGRERGRTNGEKGGGGGGGG